MKIGREMENFRTSEDRERWRTFVQVKIGREMENFRTSEDRESDGELSYK